MISSLLDAYNTCEAKQLVTLFLMVSIFEESEEVLHQTVQGRN